MGEMRYVTNNGRVIQFDEESDYGCLCTFPHNNEVAGNVLSKGTIASLALLGAAVAISANKPENMNKDIMATAWGNDVYLLPNCIPEWIRNEIDRILRIKPMSEETHINALDKYMKNAPLNRDDVWEMLQRRLYELYEIQDSLDISDPGSNNAGEQEKAIRYTMDLVQRME